MPGYLKLDSLTAAQSAKRLLQRHAIRAAVRRDPQPDRRRGCGFALFLFGDETRARELLQAHGFSFERAQSP